jgi:hexokinase
MMEDAMQACQNEGVSRDKQIPVDPVLIQDGPLVGAAVAAAMAGEGR